MTVIAYYSGSVKEEMEKRIIHIYDSVPIGDVFDMARRQEHTICGGGVLVKIEMCPEYTIRMI